MSRETCVEIQVVVCWEKSVKFQGIVRGDMCGVSGYFVWGDMCGLSGYCVWGDRCGVVGYSMWGDRFGFVG